MWRKVRSVLASVIEDMLMLNPSTDKCQKLFLPTRERWIVGCIATGTRCMLTVKGLPANGLSDITPSLARAPLHSAQSALRIRCFRLRLVLEERAM